MVRTFEVDIELCDSLVPYLIVTSFVSKVFDNNVYIDITSYFNTQVYNI